jgi:uncharacterized membrane protein (DUF373 family)
MQTNNINSLNKKLLKFLDTAGNVIILGLILALVIYMFYNLYNIFFLEFFKGEFSNIIDELILTLILMEVFTILYTYLVKHHISVERVVELGIISIVREMLFKTHEFEASKIYSISVLLVAFGLIFFIERYWNKSKKEN